MLQWVDEDNKRTNSDLILTKLSIIMISKLTPRLLNVDLCASGLEWSSLQCTMSGYNVAGGRGDQGREDKLEVTRVGIQSSHILPHTITPTHPFQVGTITFCSLNYYNDSRMNTLSLVVHRNIL